MLEFNVPDVPVLTITAGGRAEVDDLTGLSVEIEKCMDITGHYPNWVIVTGESRPNIVYRGLEAALASAFGKKAGPIKLAVLDGAGASIIARRIARIFPNVKIRHFSLRNLQLAKAWAGAANDHPGQLVPLEELGPDVVGFRAEGVITANEYNDTLVRLLENRTKSQGRIKLVMIFGEEFDSFSDGAIWEDLEFGIGHQEMFEKVAIVTETGFFLHGGKVFAPFNWTNIRVFKLTDLEAAYDWLGCHNQS